MDDHALLRYARHLLLDDIGVQGQERLLRSRALVLGVGGLGCAAAQYLATAGVGTLTLVDGDVVDLSNLQRQVLHTQERVGQPKVQSAAVAVHALNAQVQVHAVAERADAARLRTLVAQADVVLDCSDNFATRQALNATCVALQVPLVWGAAVGFDGQLSVVDTRHAPGPCYACVFPPQAVPEETQCATLGVFAPLVGIIGSMQAAEALKILSGAGTPATGRLLMLDVRDMRWSEIALVREPTCPVCAKP